jgi:carboxylesterase
MRDMRLRLAVAALLVFVAFGLWIVALCLLPLRPTGLAAHPHPAAGYDDAVERVRALQALDGPEVNPVCRTRLYTHGTPTERVIVCLHGLTNCPAQFDSLARLAYASGSNVFVPRMPMHGFTDRMTPALGALDAGLLCTWTDRVLDAADGLGGHVVVVGLSLGGTLAAWGAQERTDIDKVVLVAPMLGVPTAHGASIFGLTRVLGRLPNAFVWWDAGRRENLVGPPQEYPRFATRAVASDLLIAARVRADAAQHPPGAHSVELVTLAHDPAVDNLAAQSLLTDWRLHGLSAIRTHEFSDHQKLSHDLIDPRQAEADPGLTYPILLEALRP